MNSNFRSQAVNGLIALGMGMGMSLSACRSDGSEVDGGNPRQGHIELGIDSAEASCLDGSLSGSLLLTSMKDGSETALSAQTLCTSTIRRELPAGLYHVSWWSAPDDDTSPRWLVRDHVVLGVLPGDVTRVSVHTRPMEPALSLNQ
jgi:hypothetical protein